MIEIKFFTKSIRDFYYFPPHSHFLHGSTHKIVLIWGLLSSFCKIIDISIFDNERDKAPNEVRSRNSAIDWD